MRFVKAHYFWKSTELEHPYNMFVALHSFMMVYYKKLWDNILLSAENDDTKYLIKYPTKKRSLFSICKKLNPNIKN